MVPLLLRDRALLHGVGIGLVAPERDAEGLADLLARSLVVGMRVGERMRRDGATLELAQDAAPRAARGGVDQHVAYHVDVDPVRREAAQQPDVVGELTHSA